MSSREAKVAIGQVGVETIAQAIIAAMPAMDSADHKIATVLYRLLGLANPVDPAAVAAEAHVPLEQVERKLQDWPGVYRDGQGRVIGFWGHAITKLDPEYRLIGDGSTTYAWCALDTLFIPAILGRPLRVEASDPVSGESVSLLVDSDGPREISPVGAAVSMVVPEDQFGYDVIESFCHRVFFFASQDTGRLWVAEHPGTTLLSVDDAFAIGHDLAKHVVEEDPA